MQQAIATSACANVFTVILASASSLSAQVQFADAESWPAAGDWASTVIADFDGDGMLDALLAGQGVPYELHRGDGFGGFADVSAGLSLPSGYSTNAVVAGDLDGDGDADLVLVGNEPMRVFSNDGVGSFADVTPSAVPAGTTAATDVALADFDSDGDLDLLTAVRGQNQLFHNDGSGVFSDATANLPIDSSWSSSLAIGDANGDGLLDVVVANTAEFGPTGWIAQRNTFWVNTLSGVFVDLGGVLLPPDTEWTEDVELVDVDGDGDLDLVTADSPSSITGVTAGGRNRLYENIGSGLFADATATNMPFIEHYSGALAAADVDGDGDVDLYFANGLAPVPALDSLFLNDGSGVFSDASQRLPGVPTLGYGVQFADPDRDGDPDVFVTDTVHYGGTGGLHLTNRHRHLSAGPIPGAGGAVSYTAYAEIGYAAAPHTVIVGLSPATTSIAVPPFGVLGLVPGATVLLGAGTTQAPDGVLSLTVTFPPAGALVGASVYAQALLGDGFSPPRLTNVVPQLVLQ